MPPVPHLACSPQLLRSRAQRGVGCGVRDRGRDAASECNNLSLARIGDRAGLWGHPAFEGGAVTSVRLTHVGLTLWVPTHDSPGRSPAPALQADHRPCLPEAREAQKERGVASGGPGSPLGASPLGASPPGASPPGASPPGKLLSPHFLTYEIDLGSGF